MSEPGEPLDNPLLDAQALAPELAVLEDERALFFLSYVHNSGVQLTYYDLLDDLNVKLC